MFKRDDERTPKELAERALKRTLGRLGACGLLVYFIVQFFMKTKTETPSTAIVVVAVVLLVLSAVVIGIIIVDFIKNLRAGVFSASSYADSQGDSAGCGCETDDDALQPPGESEKEDQE
jgi:flagellar biosynthesis/type III secretory pathway M-ring protein FliF/YscJ